MSKHRGISHMPDTEALIDPVREIMAIGFVITRAEIAEIFNQIMAELNALEGSAA